MPNSARWLPALLSLAASMVTACGASPIENDAGDIPLEASPAELNDGGVHPLAPASTDCTGSLGSTKCNFPPGAPVRSHSVSTEPDGSILNMLPGLLPALLPQPMTTWRRLVSALDAGQMDVALGFIKADSRAPYAEAFQALGPDIQRLSRDWSTPEAVSKGPNFMTYLVVDKADNGGVGHLVTLVLEDGRWVVDQL